MSGTVPGGARVLIVLDRIGSTLDGLNHLLSLRRRRRLAEAIFMDVLGAVQESRLADTMVLATEDKEAAGWGRDAGIRVTASVAPEDVDESRGEAVKAVALLRGDLPALEGQDLAFLLGRIEPSRRLLLVPTPGSQGLSMVLAMGADAFLADFRTGTLGSWTTEAGERGLRTEVFATPVGMRPSSARDLLQIYTAARSSQAKGLLKEWRIGPKLREWEGEAG